MFHTKSSLTEEAHQTTGTSGPGPGFTFKVMKNVMDAWSHLFLRSSGAVSPQLAGAVRRGRPIDFMPSPGTSQLGNQALQGCCVKPVP